MTRKKQENPVNVLRLALTVLLIYCGMVVSFYFLSGEQLFLRASRGSLEMPAAEVAAPEVVQGMTIEQNFSAEIQRLKSISVQWGTFYRPNAGSVSVELVDKFTGSVILKEVLNAAEVTECQITELALSEPTEGLYDVPLCLRITADSLPGAAIAPLMNINSAEEKFSLTVNGVPTDGMLCFTAKGEDYIWTGLHYWEFAAAGFLIILAVMGVILWKQKHGKRSYIIGAVTAVKKYRFLIRQLVSRDFKTKYKRSVLGVMWSFLNPLLTMCVQYVVFSTIFKSDIKNFPTYLIIGTVTFNFFSEACGMSLMSILGNAHLITKVYMPKYIYPLTRTLSSGVNLLISLIPLVLVCLFTGVHFRKSVFLALLFLVCVFIFSLGLGMILASSMVFFRDTQFLWNVMNMIWMYITPIFYPETILPENLRFVLQINPLYHYIKNIRLCVIDGISPEPIAYVQCFLIAFTMLFIGSLVFKKTQDRFVLYL